jgi:hypothetical protein
VDDWTAPGDIVGLIEKVIEGNATISLIPTSNLPPDLVENILIDPAILPEIIWIQSISNGNICPLPSWSCMKIKNNKHLMSLIPRQEIVDQTKGVNRRVGGDGVRVTPFL